MTTVILVKMSIVFSQGRYNLATAFPYELATLYLPSDPDLNTLSNMAIQL